jgi:hypothetical protein
MIDVSYSSAVTGLLHVAVQSIRNCLDAIAYNPRARVGVMTYDSRLHFYRINVCSIFFNCICFSKFLTIPLEDVMSCLFFFSFFEI